VAARSHIMKLPFVFEEALKLVLEKYKNRLEKGSIGSESD
jgi:hypothetical protein